MSETKDDIAAERDQLRAEVENLRGQLAASGAGRPSNVAPALVPFLSEGDRQALQQFGVTTVPGHGLITADDAVRLFDNVQPADVEPTNDAARKRAQDLREGAQLAREGILGVTHVYPSVRPGVLADEAAGTPGVSGPSESEVAAAEKR